MFTNVSNDCCKIFMTVDANEVERRNFMQFRHEMKHEITFSDMMALRVRLSAVCKRDRHATDGKYLIRSLYFDNPNDSALREKNDGVLNREKFRIRYYNGDLSFIHLEKKVKRNSLGYKLSCALSAEEAQKISDGDMEWMKDDARELIRELYGKWRTGGFEPKTVVDYTREPFVFEAGNVRVTLDYNIRTGMSPKDFLNPECPTLAVQGNPIILEVKWDDYLPTIIKDAVRLENCRTGAFSKYAACRAYD